MRDARSCADVLCKAAREAQAAGSINVIENPANSYMLILPSVLQFAAEPGWSFTAYFACCWGGRRREAPKLISSIPGLDFLEVLCSHIHKHDEWRPKQVEDEWVCPTKGEAEYTAQFACTVACAASAHVALTKQYHLRRRAPPEASPHGDRSTWITMPPERFRTLAMEVLGTRLGLRPPENGMVTPGHISIDEVDVFPEAYVYIGQGHAKWGSQPTRWAMMSSPYDESINQYSKMLFGRPRGGSSYRCRRHSREQHCFAMAPQEIHAMQNLWSCWQPTEPNKEYTFTSPSSASNDAKPKGRVKPRGPVMKRPARSWLRMSVATTGLAPAQSVATDIHEPPWHMQRPTQTWSQHEVHSRVRHMSQTEWLSGFIFLAVEYILCQDPFCAWNVWSSGKGIDALPQRRRRAQSASAYSAMGMQAGAMNHKLASSPAIGHGLTAEEHFREACSLQDAGCAPSFQPFAAWPDIEFAACISIQQAAAIAEARAATAAAVTELSARCKYLTDHLRQFQPSSVAQFTASLNLGLVCLIAVVMQWPDNHLPKRMMLGFATTGTLEEPHLYVKSPGEAIVPSLSRPYLFEQAPDLLASIERSPLDEEAHFLLALLRGRRAHRLWRSIGRPEGHGCQIRNRAVESHSDVRCQTA